MRHVWIAIGFIVALAAAHARAEISPETMRGTDLSWGNIENPNGGPPSFLVLRDWLTNPTGNVSSSTVKVLGGTAALTLAQRFAGCDASGSNCTIYNAADYGMGASKTGAQNQAVLTSLVATVCAASPTDSVIRLPGGSLQIDTTAGEISIPCGGVRIEGLGIGSTVIFWTAGGNNLFHFQPANGQPNAHGDSIAKLRVFPQVANSSSGAAVLLDRTNVFAMDEIELTGGYRNLECSSCVNTFSTKTYLDGDNTSAGSYMLYVHNTSIASQTPSQNNFMGLEADGGAGGAGETYSCIFMIQSSDGIGFAGGHAFRGGLGSVCTQLQYANSQLTGLYFDGFTTDEGGFYGTGTTDHVAGAWNSFQIAGWTSDSFTVAASGNGNSSGVIPVASTTGVIVGETVTGTNVPSNAVVGSFITNTSISIVDATTGNADSAASVTNGTTLTLAVTAKEGGWIYKGGAIEDGDYDGILISDTHLLGANFDTWVTTNSRVGAYITGGTLVSLSGLYINNTTSGGGYANIQLTGGLNYGSVHGVIFGGPAQNHPLYDILVGGGNHYSISGNQYPGDYTTAAMVVVSTVPDVNIDEYIKGSHILVGPAVGALTSCGGGTPSVSFGATDAHGTLTEGTSATGCTMAWNHTHSAVPDCTYNSQSGLAALTGVASTTGITFTNTLTSSGTITWTCQDPGTNASGNTNVSP